MDDVVDRLAPARSVVLVGVAGLATGVGIGRFAFTPLLPLMQRASGLTLAQGGRLAAANYAGYLTGALWCVARQPQPNRMARAGLAGVALATLAMGTTGSIVSWAVWRFAAGVAGALVLVGISTWSLGLLARHDRAHLSGRVFAGVGVGSALTGLVALAAGEAGAALRSVWIGFGAAAALVAALSWRPLTAGHLGDKAVRKRSTRRWTLTDLRLVAAYATFGFGYIVPATFLPAQARQLVDDAAAFGLVWPIFGATAAASTLLAVRVSGRASPTTVWAAAQLVMAAGVLTPALVDGIAGVLIAAVLVGSTFMVVTMTGLQSARLLGGPDPARLAAAMTAAFAAGQLIGPLAVAPGTTSIVGPSLAAGALLVVGALALSGRPFPSPVAAPTAPAP